MENRYHRNRIYINEEDQRTIKEFRILLAGAGIGSVIAECLLRFGFENLTIIDGDNIELSNLNRQNYTESDIGNYKTISLQTRLLSINKNARIKIFSEFITVDNVSNFIHDFDIAINALDFSSDVPFLFDEICQKKNIPVIHPYNFGWAGFVTIISPTGDPMDMLGNNFMNFEFKVAAFLIDNLKKTEQQYTWIEDFINEYKAENLNLSPPQLSAGVYLLAAMVNEIIFSFVRDKKIKYFPDFYFTSLIS